MTIPARDKWLLSWLFSLRLRNCVGVNDRRVTLALARENPADWKALPKWFRDEARPLIDPKWKPKVVKPKFDAESIMDAINEAIKETPNDQEEKGTS